MSNLQPYAGSSSPRPFSRTSRAVGRVIDSTELAITRTAASAAIESAKLDAIQALTSQSLHSVAITARIESELAQAVPAASGRLNLIAEIHCLAVSELLTSAPRRLG